MIDTTDQVLICDCVLRDGFQILPDPVPLQYKKRILKLLVDSGIRDIEITSMVPPKLVPQFGDAADMIAYANELDLQTPTVLVPNLKGAERAIAVGTKSIVLPVSVSEAHSNKNIRKSRVDQVTQLKKYGSLSTNSQNIADQSWQRVFVLYLVVPMKERSLKAKFFK